MAGPVFLKQPDGSMVPFSSAEEARAFQARGGGPAPGEMGYDRTTGVPTVATAAPLPEGTPEPVATGPLNMTKNGRVVEMAQEDVARARDMGWATATDADVQAAREMRSAGSPFGRGGFFSELGNELIAGTEALASGLVGSATALTNLAGITQGASGHGAVAHFEATALNLFGAQLSHEQSERRLRYRAQQNEIGAAVGEITSYVVAGGALTKGLGLAAKAATGAEALGLGARAAIGAAEGLGTGAIAVREEAWVQDREITGADVLAQALPMALFGAAMPLGIAAGGKTLRAGAAQAKKVFGAASKLKPSALAGEMEAAGKKLGVDVEGLRASAEVSKRLKAEHETLSSLGVNPQEYAKRAAGRSPGKHADVDKVIQEDLSRYYKAKLSNGEHVATGAQDRPGIIENANRRLQWETEATKKVDDMIESSGVSVNVDDLRSRLSSSAPRGEWDVANPKADAFDQVAKTLDENARSLGKRELSGADLQQLRLNLLSNAKGENGAVFASAAETVESLIKEKMEGATAKEFAEALADKRVSRELSKGAKRQIEAQGMGGFDSIQENAAQYAIGVAQAPFHPLAAATRQIKAASQFIGRPLREAKIRRNAERYFQGQAAFAEAADSAVLSLFTRTAKSLKYKLADIDFSKATGGVVPNSVGRAIVTGPAHYLNKHLYGESPDDDGQRRGVTELNNAYVRTRDLVVTQSGDMIPLMETINARVGTSDEHPMLTMELAAGVVTTMGYLSTALPKGMSQSPAMPMSPDLPPSEMEMRVFMRKFEAVMNPWSLIEQLGQGTLSKESVEAVSQAYPGFYMRLSERVQRYLGSYPGRLPYDKACQLEIMLQSPGMLVPQNRPRFQATYTQVAKMVEASAGVGPGGKPPAKPSGSAPTLSQQMRSPVNQAIDNIHN